MSLSEVARLLWRAIWFERRLQPRILKSPKCAAATRPGRTKIGENRDFSFRGRLAESAKTRGASESEPAALKVQLGAVAAMFRGHLIVNIAFFFILWRRGAGSCIWEAPLPSDD